MKMNQIFMMSLLSIDQTLQCRLRPYSCSIKKLPNNIVLKERQQGHPKFISGILVERIISYIHVDVSSAEKLTFNCAHHLTNHYIHKRWFFIRFFSSYYIANSRTIYILPSFYPYLLFGECILEAEISQSQSQMLALCHLMLHPWPYHQRTRILTLRWNSTSS